MCILCFVPSFVLIAFNFLLLVTDRTRQLGAGRIPSGRAVPPGCSDDKRSRLESYERTLCEEAARGAPHFVTTLAISDRGPTVASGGVGGSVRIWECVSDCVRRWSVGRTRNCAFSLFHFRFRFWCPLCFSLLFYLCGLLDRCSVFAAEGEV